MENQEAFVYREIQRSADHMIKMLDIMSEKVYDRELALQISRQSVKISQISDRAGHKLLHSKAEGYHSSYLEDVLQRGNLQLNTLLNTSTGHIAQLLIENTTRGVLDMEKALRHYPEVPGECSAMARELMELEEKNIAQFKEYL